MDSPSFQSLAQASTLRAHATFSHHAITNKHAAIHKSSHHDHRHRSISASRADRLYHFAADRTNTQPDIDQGTINPSSTLGTPWLITPQHSPEPQAFGIEQPIQAYPQWTAPTPPRSDSGIPSVSVDFNDVPVTTGISISSEFVFEPPTAQAEMSSLGFLLPTQYGSGPGESDPASYTMDQNYIPSMRMSQPATTCGTTAYAQTSSSSPSHYQQSRTPDLSSGHRQSDMPASSAGQAYDQNYRRISSPYDNMSSGAYSMPPSQNIPSISGITQSPLPSPGMNQTPGAHTMPQYNSSMSRSPNMYDSNMYSHQPAYTTAPSAAQLYASSQSMSYPPPYASPNEALAKSLSGDSSTRVLNQRPKPQCWEHGCNGRHFSTFSNLLRHQREKSGTSSKSYCPKCGAEFTRTTARNGHLAHDKCTKQRRSSDGSK